MTITLDHTLVPAYDKDKSAQFYSEMFGLKVEDKSPGSRPGRFAVVRVGEMRLVFDTVENVTSHHYAFHVSDDEFDRILERMNDIGITYSADPMHRKPGKINDNEGGRGLYFHDPNGHNLELLTRI